MNYREEITVDGRVVATLVDILPASGPMKMLIIAKTPTPISVEAGHYFQGRQGRMFWNRLIERGLLHVPAGKYEDEVLLEHGYGITDIVKVPRVYRNEPSDTEYRQGLDRILATISRLHPQVVLFVYKGVLDQLLRLGFHRQTKSRYGFNPEWDALFHSKAFVFPMPGTPCTAKEAERAMHELQLVLGSA